MAAGCTVVLKPSEVAPLDAFILTEVINDIGLPNGVFNLVTGTGAEVGEAISKHPLIDMVSFTGSTRAGKAVAAAASRSEEHTSELQSLMRISYAVFCLKKKKKQKSETQ